MTPRLTLEEEQQLMHDYASGNVSLSRLALRYLVPKSTLRRRLLELQVPMRAPGGQYRRTDRYDEQQTIKAYNLGIKYKEIGQALQAHPSLVAKILSRHGVSKNRRVRTAGLSMAEITPPYTRKKLVLLGLLWASVTSTTKGKSDEIVVRSRDRKTVDNVRFQLRAHSPVREGRRGKQVRSGTQNKAQGSWYLRLRSTRLVRLLRKLDPWKLPHLRSFFEGVVTRLGVQVEGKNGDGDQVMVKGRAEVIEALNRFLTGLIPGFGGQVHVDGYRSRLVIPGMSLGGLLRAIEDPLPERPPVEVSARETMLNGMMRMTA